MKKILFILIALIVVGGGVWWFWFRSTPPISPVEQNPNQRTSSSTVQKEVEPIVDEFPNDKDRDGLDDQKEKELGLSNREFDTDGDGISDKDELERTKTNPLDKDTDKDGFSDGFEILKGYNPNGPGKLEPRPASTSTSST